MQDKINTQLLDSELSKLKAIGLKEMSKSTKLASSKIEDILEKRFDKIDRVRAKGFIAIIEREYNVDLRDWIALQEQTQKQNIRSVSEVISRQDEEQRSKRLEENILKEQEIAKEREEKRNAQKKRDTQVLDLALKNRPINKSNAETYTWLYVVLVVILLVLIGYFAYKAFIQDYQGDIPKTPTIEADSQGNNEENTYDGMFFDTTNPQDSQTPQQSIEGGIQERIQDEKQTQEITSSDILQPKINVERSQNSPEGNFFFKPPYGSTSVQTINDNILHIQSEHELWLGVIDLEKGTKEQFSYKKEYDVKLSNQMLLIMGHSSFKLTLNGKEIPHSTKHPVRMYYDGTTLSDIGYGRFKQLNGGLEW